MLIDCDGCAVRGLACDDCVVTVLLGALPGALEVDDGEQAALAVLADGGLVPRLRLVPLGLPRGACGPARTAGSGHGSRSGPDGQAEPDAEPRVRPA